MKVKVYKNFSNPELVSVVLELDNDQYHNECLFSIGKCFIETDKQGNKYVALPIDEDYME